MAVEDEIDESELCCEGREEYKKHLKRGRREVDMEGKRERERERERKRERDRAREKER